MDTMTAEDRSALMARIKGTDTRPEMAVRSVLHRLGYRFRLHRRDLPGTPDVVLPSRRAVVMVNGCFWHRHGGCPAGSREPKSNVEFWSRKFRSNVERDGRVLRELRGFGWKVVTVWECEARDAGALVEKLRRALE
jgi:DNA mismatch endonuclease (patch repair protein)